jgi:molecular chaperone HtpG
MSDSTPKHAFRAEVSALLNLVTNSLYTHSEIFLRELISNASDALDKARFQALVDSGLRGQDLPAEIRLTADKDRGVLVIEDTGIGMTRDECVENLGTIAHSGTLKFLKAQKEAGKAADINLIGQFGVGFYSAFMVAKHVEVESLSAQPGAEAVRWISDGQGEYELEPGTRSTRGTRIELHLKDESKEFLDRWRIEGIVKRYSNYVMHPIRLQEIGGDAKDNEDDDKESRQINAATALWTRSAKELSEEDYQEFYKHVMGGFVLPGDEALARMHLSMDAPIQFHALLFVPGRAPADLFMEDRKALSLYARRILVDENCDTLLPQYLRFFRGVVDSEDLPLNVSRETLQDNAKLQSIRKQLTRKALKLLADKAGEENKETYNKIWNEFGAVIKEGIHLDGGHRDEITALLRFKTIAHDNELISLAQYAAAMPSEQEVIYYIAGENEQALRNSPHVEAVRAKGHDVLLMTDSVDEWVLQSLTEFESKKLRSVTQGDLNETDDESVDPSVLPLVEKAKSVLGDKVGGVRTSKRLTESAACLVDEEGGLSRNMQRILRMARRGDDGFAVPPTRRILEINPNHPFVKEAAAIATANSEDPRLGGWIEILHDLAGLAEGQVADPTGTVKRLQSLLTQMVGAKS